MEQNNHLAQTHLDNLHSSAISDEVIIARGYRTILDGDELRKLGFAPKQRRGQGLLIPLWTTDGQNGQYVYRPDNPRVVENRRKTNPDGTHPVRVIKYEIPKGHGVRLDCPPSCQPSLADPSIPLWITEGQKKADALASVGFCAVALLGVWNFLGKNAYDAVTFLADWDYIALKGRHVRLIFDSDLLYKRPVQQALERLKEHLQRKGAYVEVVFLPPQPNGSKVGVDDWLAAGHTGEELEELVEAPRPAPKPATPLVELLDASPFTISMPRVLIDGRGYVATWINVRVSETESVTKDGEIVRHDPPRVKQECRLFIIRDDGTVFGDGGHESLDALGFEVRLPEIPPLRKLWDRKGVEKYVAGDRPSPGDVFHRLSSVINHFIDFDRSLADQWTMSELIACYVLSTWFLDAFNVVGFPWPNGDRGSGKTNLLALVAELSYLGHLILAGGTFASIRDMADYGATLAFDDAENLADPRKTDPDKRALLLAGNRRGVVVPVKELGPDKRWFTRYVNAFCPRLFCAIRLPDPVLASRTIIIPLIRSSDRTRANIDPLDYAEWPCDRDQLLSDLWALALANLKDLPRFDKLVGTKSNLSGRALQPWRAILAVAAWLESVGVPGLWARMENVAENYQSERPEFEPADLTALVIKGLLRHAIANIADIAKIANFGMVSSWQFSTTELTGICRGLANESEGDFHSENITAQRVGWTLRKLRLTKPSRPLGQNARIWKISHDELIRLASSYGIVVPENLLAESPLSFPKIGDVGDVGDIGDREETQDGTDFNLSGGVL